MTKKTLSLILTLFLTITIFSACNSNPIPDSTNFNGGNLKEVDVQAVGDPSAQGVFNFAIRDNKNHDSWWEVRSHTAKTIGEALVEHGLIEGEMTANGFIVHTANGITAKKGEGWEFYIGKNLADTNIYDTPIGNYTTRVYCLVYNNRKYQ